MLLSRWSVENRDVCECVLLYGEVWSVCRVKRPVAKRSVRCIPCCGRAIRGNADRSPICTNAPSEAGCVLGGGRAGRRISSKTVITAPNKQERPATTILTSPDGIYYFNRSASPAHFPLAVLCNPPKTDEHKPRNNGAADSDTGSPGTATRRHTNRPGRPAQGSASTTLARGRRRQCHAPDNPHH